VLLVLMVLVMLENLKNKNTQILYASSLPPISFLLYLWLNACVCAQIYRYQGQYTLAAADFWRAAELDPGLPCRDALAGMDALLAKCSRLAQHGPPGSNLTPRRQQLLTDALASTTATAAEAAADAADVATAAAAAPGEAPGGATAALVRCSVADLSPGHNPGRAIALAVVGPVDLQSDFPPAPHLMLDCTGSFVVAALYHVDLASALGANGSEGSGGSSANNSTVVVVAQAPEVLDVSVPRRNLLHPPNSHSRGEGSEGEVNEGSEDEVYRYRCVQLRDTGGSVLVAGKPVRRADKDGQLKLKLTAFDR